MTGNKRVSELMRYVDFGPDDARRLAAVHDVLAPEFPRLAGEFYDKTREHEEAHAVFSGEEQIARLQGSLQVWLHGVFGGVYDDAYFERIERIGEVHVRVGLPQRFMVLAMCCLRVELARLIGERAEPEHAEATRASLHRALDVELAIMLDAYHAADLAHLARTAEALTHDRADAAAGGKRAPARVDLAQAYLAAIELTHELVIGLDAGGAVRIFNHGAEASTGYRRDEVLGLDFATTLLPEDARERVGTLLAGAAPRQARVETRIRTRTGKERDVRWDVALTGEGQVRAFFIGHDQTEEVILAQRSRRAEKLAAVGTLAAGLAHEIRNPLNGAQLHVAFLERTLTRQNASRELLEAVGVVGGEIKRLASLVTDFLDFARPTPLDRRSVSLGALVERVAGLLESEASKVHVGVRRDLPTREVNAEIDAAKMEQVLLNLARNAIEACAPAGGGNVTLRLRRQPRSGVLEIEDDGPGLPAGDAPIFDAFYTTKADGTGLGLSITHRIVTDHDGTVEVDSRPGRTVFRVALPLVADRSAL